MTGGVSPDVLRRLGGFVADALGLHFPPERFDDLSRGLNAAAAEFGFDDPQACADWLLGSPLTRQQVEVLASHLTVGETYFFREGRSFQVLEDQILAQILQQRRGHDQRLRVWSAGCCTGEEAYSLAISLTRAIPDLSDWDVTILGTDINPCFLRRAMAGLYSEWSFRGVPADTRERYFVCEPPRRWRIRPDIQRLVRFEYLNLAEGGYPSLLNGTNATDVIFCRNVLIYHRREQAGAVVERLARSLSPEGWLVLGASETSLGAREDLAQVAFPEAVVYRRKSVPAEPPSSPVATAFAVAIDEPRQSGAVDRSADAHAPHAGDRDAEAVEDVKASVSDGHGTDAMVLLARMCANKGDLSVAEQWCRRALEGDKLNPEIHHLMGTVLEELARWPEAAAAYRRAIFLSPDLVMAHVALAQLARRLDHPAEADRHLRNAVTLLARHRPDAVLAGSEGLTAGRLAQMLAATGTEEEAQR